MASSTNFNICVIGKSRSTSPLIKEGDLPSPSFHKKMEPQEDGVFVYEAPEIPEFKFVEIEDGQLVEKRLISVSIPSPVNIGELIMETLRKRIEALGEDKVDDFDLNGFDAIMDVPEAMTVREIRYSDVVNGQLVEKILKCPVPSQLRMDYQKSYERKMFELRQR